MSISGNSIAKIGQLLLLAISWMACAEMLQAQSPSIEMVEMPAVQQGSSCQLKLIGSNLASIRELLFYETGVVCQAIEARGTEEVIVHLNCRSDCTTGRHAFRARTDNGFTECKTFTVTPFPIVRESQLPSPLPRRVSIVGDLSDGESDVYTVQIRESDRLSVDVEAIRLGIDLVDTGVVIRDPAGEVVADADDSSLYRQDPIASIVARRSGSYTIEVHDAGRTRSQQSVYVLHLSDGPRPTSVFPLGGQPGSTVELSFAGDCRGETVGQHKLPEMAASTLEPYRLVAEDDGNRAATSLPFRLSPLPNVMENMDNDNWPALDQRPASSNRIIETPVALNGRLERPVDRDCFWLKAIPGQRLQAEVYAYRLGSAVDALLTMVDSTQAVLTRCDDLESLDGRAEVVVPADGLVGVAIEDKGGGGGDTFTYRVEIAAQQPSTELFLPRRDRLTQDLQTIAVPAGNRVLALMAVRKDDSAGSPSLRFPQLPNGIRVHFQQPKAEQAIVPVVFEAASDSPLAGELVPVEVSVHSAEATAVGSFHQVTDLVSGAADTIYAEHHTDRLAVCTRATYPVTVRVLQPDAALAQDGTLSLRVEVERQPDFNGEVDLLIPWLPPWVDADPRLTIPADKSEAIIRLRAWQQAESATWPLVIEAVARHGTGIRRARMSGSDNPSTGIAGESTPAVMVFPEAVASPPIDLSIAPSPARGHLDSAAGEQGETIAIHCQLSNVDALPSLEEFTATLEGLPNRVESQPVVLTGRPKSIRFEVRLDPTAPVGQYVGLACRLSGRQKSNDVSFVIARDGQLTIGKPGQVVRDAAGRSLNRVEALRRKLEQGVVNTDAH